jgi:glycosyltransferase involved in cell wall biosynthesis
MAAEKRAQRCDLGYYCSKTSMDASTVSIVIPTLNEATYLGNCLRTIANLERPAGISTLEVVVVDNFSTDSTAEIARSSGVKLIQLPPKNVGNSRNTGAKAVNGSFLAFVDADCGLDSLWLVRCFPHLLKPEVVGVGTHISSPLPDAPWVEKYWYELGYQKPEESATEVEWLPTFNLIVKRDAFLEVGGFNENLATCEDSDLGYKLSALGKLILESSVTTRHYRESKNIPEFYKRERWRGMGNLKSFFMHKFRARELPSLLYPLAFLGMLFAAPLVVFSSAMEWLPAASASIVGGGLTAGPVLQVLRKRIYPWQGKKFAACLVLATVYLYARSIALLRGAARIS